MKTAVEGLVNKYLLFKPLLNAEEMERVKGMCEGEDEEVLDGSDS